MRSRLRPYALSSILLAVATFAGCVSSTFTDGVFACDPITAPECPPELVCASDKRCRSSSIVDAGAPRQDADDGAIGDAGGDAAAKLVSLVGNPRSGGAPSSTDGSFARAFKYVAGTTGTVGHLSILLDPSNRATSLELGLYDEAFGHPDQLLAHVDVDGTTAGWRAAPVSPVRVTKGVTYWIAVLTKTPGVPVTFNADALATVRGEDAAEGDLASLPAKWPSGSTFERPPLCAFASP